MIAAAGGRLRRDNFNLDEILEETIEAIEVYTSSTTTSAQFARDGAPCGAVLFWRRH